MRRSGPWIDSGAGGQAERDVPEGAVKQSVERQYLTGVGLVREVHIGGPPGMEPLAERDGADS